MKKVSVLALVVAGCLLVASVPAKADITVWVGQIESEDLFIDSSLSFGGAIGFTFLKYVGLELVVDYAQDSALPFNLEELEDLFGVDAQMDMLFLSGNIVIQYPLEGFTPYFTTGFGGFGTRISTDSFEAVEEALSGSTAFNWGFGAKINLGGFFAIRGEWRQYRLDFSDADELGGLIEDLSDPTFSRLAIGGSITF